MDPLPIDEHLPAILQALDRSRAVVIVAEPGAGKTTRVPPALVEWGPLLLLQPRRAAARAVASRIASERQWSIGREIGWHTRFDRRFSATTRLIVATEGILTARLQRDPLLSDFRTIVLDEFHERSIHTDLGLALARQAWEARSDLRIVVMSATLDPAPAAAFLGQCPVVTVSGRAFPIGIGYRPGMSMADAACELWEQTSGNVLCFVPGAADVSRTVNEIGTRTSAEVLPLYGALDADAQDRALAVSATGARRVIVSTNIAETSVTAPGVTAVVDSGQHKVARYDHTRAIDSLVLERISQDSADQRAGRAGRVAPGLVSRLWSSADRLNRSREPELHRIDLSGCVLDLIACGEDPARFTWFERPRGDALNAALTLLRRLGALDGVRLTDVGRQMRDLPLTPRLARMLLAGSGSLQVTRAVALLSEGVAIGGDGRSASSDLLVALDHWSALPSRVEAVARQLTRDRSPRSATPPGDEELFLRAVLAGYPDRVAQRRSPQAPRFKLSTGAGAMLSRHSVVHAADFVVALDVAASTLPNQADATIRLASAVRREWLVPTSTDARTWLDEKGVAHTAIVERYDELILAQRSAPLDFTQAAPLLAAAWLDAPRSADDQRLLHRLAFAGQAGNEAVMVARAVAGRCSLAEIRLADGVDHDVMRRLAKDAPDTIVVPSGRAAALDYSADGRVSAAVKLQELFGLRETPRLGPLREPITFALLAPNGRAVQLTRDLESFWTRTYPEVRKELRGRYPKHPWPEDPWTAQATARTKKRSGT